MILFAYPYYLSLLSALRPCCLSLLPVFSPCPLPLSAFHALVAVLPRLSACFFHFLAWFCLLPMHGESFKGTWLGLMSLLRCLAQTVLLWRFAYDRLFVAFPKKYVGALRRHHFGA